MVKTLVVEELSNGADRQPQDAIAPPTQSQTVDSGPIAPPDQTHLSDVPALAAVVNDWLIPSRGRYSHQRYPDPEEPWCNCAD